MQAKVPGVGRAKRDYLWVWGLDVQLTPRGGKGCSRVSQVGIMDSPRSMRAGGRLPRWGLVFVRRVMPFLPFFPPRCRCGGCWAPRREYGSGGVQACSRRRERFCPALSGRHATHRAGVLFSVASRTSSDRVEDQGRRPSRRVILVARRVVLSCMSRRQGGWSVWERSLPRPSVRLCFSSP